MIEHASSLLLYMLLQIADRICRFLLELFPIMASPFQPLSKYLIYPGCFL